ncbi:MAG: FAD-dependent monooxygenase [Candidatus Aenigmatarchaeota archaeon]
MDGVDFDVIVVGAGTAGCYLTRKLVKNGIDACIVEKSSRTKADSGIVSGHFFDYIPDKSLVKARIKAMNLVSPSGTRICVRSKRPFAFLLERERLGKKMRAGVRSRIIDGRFVGCDVHKGWVDVKVAETNGVLRESSYSCRVLVGADGAMSQVRSALGVEGPEITWGVARRSEACRGTVSVFFNKDYSSDGFAWQIPQSGEYGVVSSAKPAECLQRFLADAKADSRRRMIGAPIPIGACRSYAERTILVGDAAGQVKPLTGGGIVWGLRCADIAARAIEYAFDAKRYDAFFWKTEYEQRWRAAVGSELKRQLLARNLYKRLNNAQIENIFKAIMPSLEGASDFDYDALSELFKAMPKIGLLRTLIPPLLRSSKGASL